jgi:F0F1-type ATP synthase assembly protein I
LTPALFGFFGWVVDGWFGTTPFLMILAAILGLGGSVANQYYRYVDRMDLVSHERLSAREAKFTPGDKRFSKDEAAE